MKTIANERQKEHEKKNMKCQCCSIYLVNALNNKINTSEKTVVSIKDHAESNGEQIDTDLLESVDFGSGLWTQKRWTLDSKECTLVQ